MEKLKWEIFKIFVWNEQPWSARSTTEETKSYQSRTARHLMAGSSSSEKLQSISNVLTDFGRSVLNIWTRVLGAHIDLLTQAFWLFLIVSFVSEYWLLGVEKKHIIDRRTNKHNHASFVEGSQNTCLCKYIVGIYVQNTGWIFRLCSENGYILCLPGNYFFFIASAVEVKMTCCSWTCAVRVSSNCVRFYRRHALR